MTNTAAVEQGARQRISKLRGQVVVITGASSGIGRATARAFAAHGARLVLIGRNADTLRATAHDCAEAGAHSLVEVADVADAGRLATIARTTFETFGTLDVWINNAGVGLFGPYLNAEAAAHRRVIETDLLGAMNGASAVLPYFVDQQRGVFLTNISVGGFVPVPFAASYTAAKFGLRGFMAALRQELTELPEIHLCSVFPAVIDTPGFQHGANVSGGRLHPAPPLFPPEKVASALVTAVLYPRPEIPVGWPSHLGKWSYGVAPLTTERITGEVFRRYVRRAEPEPTRLGNIFEPSSGRMSASGGWRADRARSQRGRPQRVLALAAVAGAAIAGGCFLARRSRAATLVPR